MVDDHLKHWRGVLAALTPHHKTWGGGAALVAQANREKAARVAVATVAGKLAAGVPDIDRSLMPPPPTPEHSAYGTLDDLPAAATKDLEALHAVTCARFKNYHGVVFWGPASHDWPQQGYWGRRFRLPSNETLQMRFWPKEAFTEAGDLSGAEFADVIYVSARVTHARGRGEVHTAVLFRPGEVHVGDDIELVDAANATRVCACRGLHLMMAGVYKRHNHTIGGVRASMGMAAHDNWGHEAIRSSTYSIFLKDRKDLVKASDHHNANGASAGPSVLAIANEFRDQLLAEDGPRRAAEPITRRKFKEQLTDSRRDLCPDGDQKAANDAIASAMACVELLSAEGLVGLLANPFFEGALPDHMVGPHGLGLTIAMACWLALNWADYNLPKPSACDMYANDQFGMIWRTSGPNELPLPDKGVWAIDLVLKASIKGAQLECEELRETNGIAKNADMHILPDHLIFWQRLGQGVITRNFGLGASPAAWLVREKDNNKFGEPWRLSDLAQRARDMALAKLGVKWEGVDDPLVPLAAPGPRKTAFIRLMLQVEHWLRTGKGPQGKTLSPSNVVAHPDETERQAAFADMLSKVMLPKLLQASFSNPGGQDVIGMAAKVLDTMVSSSALEHAVSSCGVLLVHGPMLHLTHNVGAYIVAPKQELTCTECDEKVHVLPGVMFGHSYGHCTACHSRRCLNCAIHYGKAIDLVAKVLQQQGKSGPTTVGKTCRKCGAEPAKLSVRYVMEVNGVRTTDLVLSDRTRKVRPQPTQVELRVGKDNVFGCKVVSSASPSPTGEAPSDKSTDVTATGSNASTRSAKKRGGRR